MINYLKLDKIVDWSEMEWWFTIYKKVFIQIYQELLWMIGLILKLPHLVYNISSHLV